MTDHDMPPAETGTGDRPTSPGALPHGSVAPWGPGTGCVCPQCPHARVSVVIPCRNEVGSIGATIAALRSQSRPPDEIVVVDGASTDGTLELLPRLGVTVIVEPGASIPQAVNAGVRAAAGEIIVRMDAHSTPAPEYIERALARLQEPRAGVVGGVWDVAPGGSTATAAAIARAVSHPLGAGDAAYRTGPRDAATRDVETVPFGAFARTTWESIGGFDEDLLTNEDYEFNHRVRTSGLRVILDPAIRSTYYARPTLGALARQYLRYGWWKVRMLRKHPGSLRWRQAVPAAFVAGLAALAMVGLLWRPAWWVLAGVLACYAAVLVLASVMVCVREGGWSRLPAMIAAFAVVHVAWGTGAVGSVVRAALPWRVRRTRPTA